LKVLLEIAGSAGKLLPIPWRRMIVLNVYNKTMQLQPSMNSVREGFGMAAVARLSAIVVCGGSVNGTPTNTCEQFADNKWAVMKEMPIKIRSLALMALNDVLFVFGGSDDTLGYNSVYAF
jgi:hypothetical protein